MAPRCETQASQPNLNIVQQSTAFLAQRHNVYTPLDQSQLTIRLLEIHPGSWTDPIVGRLSTHMLDDPRCPEFDALSYVWGDLDDCHEIQINGVSFKVTTSQYTALRRLRRRPDGAMNTLRVEADHTDNGNEESYAVTPARLLWIDATCIDQNNIFERGHQVEIMGKIYRQAKSVFVWFGEPFVDFDWPKEGFSRNCEPGEAFETCFHKEDCLIYQALRVGRLLGTKKHSHELPVYCRAGSNSETLSIHTEWRTEYQAFKSLLEHPWWGRVWTLQEATVSHNAPLVLLGTHCFSLWLIAEAAYERQLHHWACCLEFEKQTDSEPWVNVYNAYRVRKIYKQRQSCDLLILTRAVLLRQASDERDRIYAVRGLLKLPDFPADYTLSIPAVFAIGTLRMFREQKSIRNLSVKPLQTTQNFSLPSWVRDFSYPELKVRVDNGRKRYCSAGTQNGSIAGAEWNTSNLRVSAHRFGIVENVGPRLTVLSVAKVDWFAFAQFVSDSKNWYESNLANQALERDGDSEARNLWRSIFQNTWVRKFRTKLLFPDMETRSCEKEKFCDTGFDILARSLQLLPKYLEDGQSRPIDEALHQLFQMIDLLYFNCGVTVYTTDTGHVGIGWSNVEVGDEIYLVKGSPKPLILKTVGVHREPRYQMVFSGSCYIDGIMYGEAVNDQTSWIDVELV